MLRDEIIKLLPSDSGLSECDPTIIGPIERAAKERLTDAILALIEKDRGVCEWEWNVKNEWWDVSCEKRRTWVFTHDLQRVTFCPWCGKPIKEVK